MKRLTLIIIGVLLCTPLYSDMNTYIAGVPVSGGGSYLVQEDFEGTGTPTGWTQYGQRPLPNFDYTATVLEGDQSMHLSGTGYGLDQAVNTPAQTASTDQYIAYMHRTPAPDTGITGLQAVNDGDVLAYIKVDHLGGFVINLAGGDLEYSATGVISADTTQFFKVRYQAGEPAVVTVWVSSDGSTWTQAVQANDVNITAGVTHWLFRSNEGSSYTPIIDEVRISNEDISY